MGVIEETIKQLGWVRVGNMERVIRALVEIGIDPKKCFIDPNDNLIIPVSEIQKNQEDKKA